LLFDFWGILKGQEKDEVSVDDIEVLTMGVLRLVDKKRVGTEHDIQENQDIGFFNSEGQFCLKPEDIPAVHKHFDLLFLNRVHHLGKVTLLTRGQKAVEHYSFKPTISKSTEQIALSFRQKVAMQGPKR